VGPTVHCGEWASHCCGFSYCREPVLSTETSVVEVHGFIALWHVVSSWTRDQAHVPCIGKCILNHWTPREVLVYVFSTYHLTNFSQFSSVAQSCPTLCDPMNLSMPGLPVPHQLLEFTQTHVHRVSDPIQPSHPLSSPSPPAPNPSQHQSLFQWINSSHEVAKVLEFQL